jgi:protein-disulfide isomerase
LLDHLEKTMTDSPKKRSRRDTNTLTSALIAGLPLMFLFGLFIGYQLWATPNVQADLANQADQANDTPQRYEIPIYDDDPTLGPENAPVTIIEFSDYECPYCQRYHQQTFDAIIDTYGDQVRYVFKDLPLTSIHPNAVPAAVAAHCASDQNAFCEFHDLLFSMQLGLEQAAYLEYASALGLDMDTFTDCIGQGTYEQIVMQDTRILTDINAPISTPTFFINGQYLAGAQPFSEFARLIDAELDN